MVGQMQFKWVFHCRQDPKNDCTAFESHLCRYTRLMTGFKHPNLTFGLWKSKSLSNCFKRMLFWIFLDAVEMRRGNEVGIMVMPSLEAAGNNIFQYFLVSSAIANTRLSSRCTLGEVLEYLQYNVICVFPQNFF